MDNKTRHDNPYQPPSFDDFPQLQPKPSNRRSPSLVGVHALYVVPEKMIRSITPYNLDELQYLLGRGSGCLTVYYPLFAENPRTAEYMAEVTWAGAEIDYTLGGHGIGSTRMRLPDRETLIDRIIADNGRFNGGGAFQIEANQAGDTQ